LVRTKKVEDVLVHTGLNDDDITDVNWSHYAGKHEVFAVQHRGQAKCIVTNC